MCPNRTGPGPIKLNVDTETHTMKITKLTLGSLLALAVGMGVVGCNENPTDSTVTVNPPSNAMAVSLSTTSVGLKWNKSTTSAATYKISWQGLTTTTVAGSMTSNDSMATVTGLTAGQAYTFSIKAISGTDSSAATSVTWAPASVYTTSVKLYEKSSSAPSGLIIDPAKGGPDAISVASGTFANVQFAVNFTADSFYVGPAYSFTEFAHKNDFDRTVYVSSNSYVVSSLDTWYSNTSIDQLIDNTTGNVSAFGYKINNGFSQSQGFFIKLTGVDGQPRYARVLLKNQGNRLDASDANGRYVQVEVSYQLTPNLPYAKIAPFSMPVAQHSVRMRAN